MQGRRSPAHCLMRRLRFPARPRLLLLLLLHSGPSPKARPAPSSQHPSFWGSRKTWKSLVRFLPDSCWEFGISQDKHSGTRPHTIGFRASFPSGKGKPHFHVHATLLYVQVYVCVCVYVDVRMCVCIGHLGCHFSETVYLVLDWVFHWLGACPNRLG